MDRLAPGLRLETITQPRQDIMRIWRTLRPLDQSFIQGIIGDMVMFAETPGTELAPTIEEYTALIQRPTPTTHGIFVPNPFTTVQGQLSTLLHIPAQDIHEELHERWDQGIRIAWLSDWTLLRVMTPTTASYQRDACHGFLLLVFRTLLFPYSPNLIDGAIAQVVLQARLRMAEGDHVDLYEEVNPSVPTLSQPPPTHALPPLTPAGVLPAYSGALPTHLPPPASSGAPLPPASLTSAATDDQACIAALEGMVNQMATNMAELLALLRGPNRASSSSTPPPGPGPTADPTSWAPPTQAPKNMEVPVPPTLHTSVTHPFTSQFPPPPAPTAVPLPPATFLSSEHFLSAPPPVSIPAPTMAYTIPPPMVFPVSSAPVPTHPQAAELPPYPSQQPHAGLSYQAPPPINTTFHEPGRPTHAAQFASPTHFFPEVDTEQERRLKRIEETIRALQDSLSGSALDWFMSLKAEDIPTWEDLSRKFTDQYRYCAETPPTLLELSTKEMARGQRFEEYAAKWRAQEAKHIPPISEAQQIQLFHSTLRGAPQQYSVNLTTASTTAPTYFPPPPQHQPQSIYYSAPLVPPPTTSQSYDHFAPAPTQPSQPRPPADGAQSRPRKQYSPLPAPISHIYWQLLAGNQIQPISPGPNFDPSVQDQSKHCEYHQGAPGHTLDNCWRLRDEIQRRIDSNRLTFNAIRPPNVQANPLPNHRPSSGPSINMISICVSERDEEA
ncbi:hypothetical protein CRG98_013470 [Punica granatum]|uniref:Retrotransposon gag domain-containing protein n=1 Tax=Punica granatum TaxID=22663 RepID=A0A2I0KEC5_PUNGR|nr:hypothetical protein CRG98_013470 [Punica granatum]